MPRKVLAVAQKGPQEDLSPSRVVRGVFTPETRAGRALARQQAEERDTERWMDLIKAVLSSPVSTAIVGAAAGVAGSEVLTMEVLAGPTAVRTVRQWEVDGALWRLIRFRVDFRAHSFLSTAAALRISIPASWFNGGFAGPVEVGPGWPRDWNVYVDVVVPPTGVPDQDVIAAAERKLTAFLRLSGAGAGAAFGLGMAAISGAIGNVARP